MSDPSDDWGCKFDATPELEHKEVGFDLDESYMPPSLSGPNNEQKYFSVPCVPSLSEEDDELTESKIKSFLDEKALELKKLQTPLYQEFYNSSYTSCSPAVINGTSDETAARKYLKLPASPPSLSFSERQRKWKDELDQELQRKREMLRQAGIGGKTSSPKDRALHRQRDRTRFASPNK